MLPHRHITVIKFHPNGAAKPIFKMLIMNVASPPWKNSCTCWTGGWVSAELFWTFWRREVPLAATAAAGIWNPDRPLRSLVTILSCPNYLPSGIPLHYITCVYITQIHHLSQDSWICKKSQIYIRRHIQYL